MKNNERNSRKRLNSLILLVAFTAVMLIVSTYAWFSTQKNVSLGGLLGEVNVAEGLQISLDALNWKNEIDLSATGIEEYFRQTNINHSLTADDKKFSLNQPYALSWDDTTPATYHKNIVPGELLPASTVGYDSIGQDYMKLYRGENTDAIVLSDIREIGTTKTEADPELGYYAIDLFLQNSSSQKMLDGFAAGKALVDKSGATNEEKEQGKALMAANMDKLFLETDSFLTLSSADKYTTGLQNSLRVGFALYANETSLAVSGSTTQKNIIEGTDASKISDVAIWEPNASGDAVTKTESGGVTTIETYPAHVDYIIQNNNRITWSKADHKDYLGTEITEDKQVNFAAGSKVPTYALTANSVTAKYTVTNTDDTTGIENIYDWSTAGIAKSKVAKQNVLATPNTGVAEAQQLVSAKDGTSVFALEPGQYCKIRMYVWLEGQDVDCINYASLGGDITINVGISKPGTPKGS